MNGNPVGDSGEIIPFYTFSEINFMRFMDDLTPDAEFVACEWQFPGKHLISALRNFNSICVFRNPYSRFISNYAYDSKYNYTDCGAIK